MCLKKDQVDAFHQNLNSINANIQFTLDLKDTNEYGLPHHHVETRHSSLSGRLQEANTYKPLP